MSLINIRFITFFIFAFYTYVSSASSAYAQDGTNTPASEAVTSRSYRTLSQMTAGVEPYVPSTWVMGKRGGFISAILSPDTTIEAEYLTGSMSLSVEHVDLASFKEELFLAAARSYFGTNHFNFRYGLGLRKYSVTLGNEYLDAVHTEVDSLVESYILSLAVGNRWQWEEGFTLGVDWFEVEIPLAQKTYSGGPDLIASPEGAKAADAAFKVLRYAPTFAFLKLQLGWSF